MTKPILNDTIDCISPLIKYTLQKMNLQIIKPKVSLNVFLGILIIVICKIYPNLIIILIAKSMLRIIPHILALCLWNLNVITDSFPTGITSQELRTYSLAYRLCFKCFTQLNKQPSKPL